MKLELAIAHPEDAAELTALAIRSKGHWGYPEEWMAAWKEELTIRPEYISQFRVVKAMSGQDLVGFYAIQPHADYGCPEVGHFWISPSFMGKGYGAALFEHLLHSLQEEGTKRLIVESDPNAIGFYRRMGGKVIGALESSIPGRQLPILEFDLIA